ncbi:MAG TPA: anti-sigma factor [Solirubrobacteraceae bacterium]|jgi:anti-sigma-K factor RskA|nr:anti-sigma factor [Solirubrobacteraceae bacterium]
MSRFDSDCGERGQAAAYVLQALERQEVERYREHLDSCAVCSADVARLQPVADSLATSVPHAVASQELRARVMASVRSEAELLHAAGAAADRPEPARPRWRMRRPQFLITAVALGVGLLIGVAVVDTGSQAPATHVTSAQLTSLPLGAKAVLRQTGGHAELVVSGVSQPPRGKIYELWLARSGAAPQPTSALFGVTRSGDASVNVPGNLSGVHQVMVTAEPLGGSSHPTSSPIIVATLPSS